MLAHVFLSCALAAPPSALVAPKSPPVSVPESRSFELGRRTFFTETFGGNGRTCATCHEPRADFTLTPEIASARFAFDPGHPLFRPKDSDDGDGKSYRRLIDHALIRVRLPLHPNVVDLDDPSRRTIDVWRGVPSISNVRFTAPYQHDGRISNLRQQALSAIHDHLDPAREPLDEELAGLVEFQNQTFEPQPVRASRDFDPALPREPGYSVRISSPAAVRGRAVFEGNCARCHDGELKHRPRDSHDPVFVSVQVSEANRLDLPKHHLQFRRRDGTLVVVETADPGLAATNGLVETLDAFEIPQLRGIKNTAPYFHDNSAATLEQVIDHYIELVPGIAISPTEKEDLLAFLDAL